MMDQCPVPLPVCISNRQTAHGVCDELRIRFVDPLDAISMPVSVSPSCICPAIKADFDSFRKRVTNHALRKQKATFLLRCAKDRFHAASTVPFDLFSLWAYQSLHRDDAPTTGAEVFHELLTWCDAFEGPDAQIHTDRLIEVSDLLGCRYTSLMLALGLYKGYRANSESIHILNCIYSVVVLQPHASSALLCELNFLERAMFTAGTFRAIRASCSGPAAAAADMFPSAIEIALAVESCVQQTVGADTSRVPTPGPLPPSSRRRRKKAQRAGHQHQSTPLAGPAEPKESTDTATLAAGTGTGTGTGTSAVPASTQRHNAGASSQQPAPAPSPSHHRPWSPPEQQRRPSPDSSSDEDQGRRTARKRAASHASSSSSRSRSRSSSGEDDDSSSDGDGPPARKRQRHAGEQPDYTPRETDRHPSPQSRYHRVPPLPVPSWHTEPPAVHGSTAISLLMEENMLQEQFLDFVSNFHANVSSAGVRLLGRLAERHHDLAQRRWWQTEQQRRSAHYRVAAADNSTDRPLEHAPARPEAPAAPMPMPRPPPPPSPAQPSRGSTHLNQPPEAGRQGHYEQDTQRPPVRYAHEVHRPTQNRHPYAVQFQGQHSHQGQGPQARPQPFLYYQPYRPSQPQGQPNHHHPHGPTHPAPSNKSHLGGPPSSSQGRHAGTAPASASGPGKAPANARAGWQKQPPRLPLLAPQPRPLRARLDEARLANAGGVPAQATAQAGGPRASTGVGSKADAPGEGLQAGPRRDDHRDGHRDGHQASERDRQDAIKDEKDGGWKNGPA